MRFFSAALAARPLLIAIMAALVLPLGVASAQQVKDSQIKVMICPAASQSGFTIDEPLSDSVTNRSKVKIRGSVQNISQLDFFINDTYNSTVAMGSADTEYDHTISLNPGTHTIKLVGYDSCQQANHTNSIVITYQQGAGPSNGGTTTTVVPGAGADSGPSSQPSSEGITTEEIKASDEGLIPGLSRVAVPRSVGDFARGLDLDTSFTNDIHGIVRGISVMLGILLLAAVPAMLWALLWPLVLRVFHRGGSGVIPAVSPSHHHHHMLMRLVGLVLIVTPFLV